MSFRNPREGGIHSAQFPEMQEASRETDDSITGQDLDVLERALNDEIQGPPRVPGDPEDASSREIMAVLLMEVETVAGTKPEQEVQKAFLAGRLGPTPRSPRFFLAVMSRVRQSSADNAAVSRIMRAYLHPKDTGRETSAQPRFEVMDRLAQTKLLSRVLEMNSVQGRLVLTELEGRVTELAALELIEFLKLAAVMRSRGEKRKTKPEDKLGSVVRVLDRLHEESDPKAVRRLSETFSSRQN